ncbi:MAG: hypothetical protein KDE66_06640 [Nitrosomonas sp.]|nr:hypothetical protein [Nitrosomonas sp.]
MNISKELKRWQKFSGGFQKQPEEDSKAGREAGLCSMVARLTKMPNYARLIGLTPVHGFAV